MTIKDRSEELNKIFGSLIDLNMGRSLEEDTMDNVIRYNNDFTDDKISPKEIIKT